MLQLNKTAQASNGFQINERLGSSDDFQLLYRSKKLFTKFFIIYYRVGLFKDNASVSPDCSKRFAVTVSKKVSKKAVQRNKIRRVVKEVYRLNRQLLPESIALVIRALPEVLCLSNSEIKNEIKTAFSSIYSKEYSN